MNDDYIDDSIQSIISYFKKDLEELGELKVVCFPIFASFNTGIEFVSGLPYGFRNPTNNKNNSGPGYKKFFKNDLSKIDARYKLHSIPEYFYSFLGNKITHGAGIGGGFVTHNSHAFKKIHLYEHIIGGTKYVYIHPLEYKNDFIKALKIVEDDYQNISSVKRDAINYFRKSSAEDMLKISELSIDLPKIHVEPPTDGTSSKELFIEVIED